MADVENESPHSLRMDVNSETAVFYRKYKTILPGLEINSQARWDHIMRCPLLYSHLRGSTSPLLPLPAVDRVTLNTLNNSNIYMQTAESNWGNCLLWCTHWTGVFFYNCLGSFTSSHAPHAGWAGCYRSFPVSAWPQSPSLGCGCSWEGQLQSLPSWPYYPVSKIQRKQVYMAQYQHWQQLSPYRESRRRLWWLTSTGMCSALSVSRCADKHG